MMPGTPGTEEDYDDPVWAPFWEAAVDLGLPLSFHILTARGQGWRGPRLNSFMSIVRSIQDIMGTLVFGGVFQRHPGLKVVCVEADAGWVPHYMYRMDHAWNRHRNWLAPGVTLERKPSEYFAEHIYVTFQDDWTAFRFADDMNWHRLMWANDFPHSDSTWPWSQELLAEQTVQLTPEQTKAILSDNVASLYKIDTASSPSSAAPDRSVAVRQRPVEVEAPGVAGDEQRRRQDDGRQADGPGDPTEVLTELGDAGTVRIEALLVAHGVDGERLADDRQEGDEGGRPAQGAGPAAQAVARQRRQGARRARSSRRHLDGVERRRGLLAPRGDVCFHARGEAPAGRADTGTGQSLKIDRYVAPPSVAKSVCTDPAAAT